VKRYERTWSDRFGALDGVLAELKREDAQQHGSSDG
jgi:hypothetical protein